MIEKVYITGLLTSILWIDIVCILALVQELVTYKSFNKHIFVMIAGLSALIAILVYNLTI